MKFPLEDRVKSLIAHHLDRPCDQIELAQSLRRDLGFDNLSLVGIALELEEQQGAEFPFECLDKVETVSDLVALASSSTSPDRRSPVTSSAPGRRLGSL